MQNRKGIKLNLRASNPAKYIAPSQADTSPLEKLRALIVSSFTGDIAAVTPRVQELLQCELNRSTDAGQQVMLRHAVQLLVSRQEALSAQLVRSVGSSFDAKLDCPADTVSHTGQFSVEALVLVEELGMQEEFDIEQWVSRLREQCGPQLSVLAVRLCDLLGRNTLPESHNPLFPRVMLRALKAALEHVGCDAGTRRIIFNAYGSLFPRIFGDVYARACATVPDVDTRRSGRAAGPWGNPRLSKGPGQPVSAALR